MLLGHPLGLDDGKSDELLEEEKQRADIAELAYQGLAEDGVSRGEYESLIDKHTAMTKAYRAAEAHEKKLREARPISEWHEDCGDVLWWTFPIEEPPYCGSPLDSDWPDYHTHWTPIVVPEKEGEAK